MTARRKKPERLQPSQQVWTARWVSPYESAFNLLQKYAWANLASVSEIARDLLGRRYLSRDSSYELLRGGWFDRAQLRLPENMPLLEGFVTAYGGHWPLRFANGRWFRFCEPCLREGYHSIFYQFDGIVRCPLHDAPLQKQCAVCGAPTVPLELRAESFVKLFSCCHCGRPLAGTPEPMPWFISDSSRMKIEHALQPIAGWLERLEDYPISTSYHEAPLAQLCLLGEYALESNEATCFQIARQIVPLSLPSNCLREPQRPLQYRRFFTRRRTVLKESAHHEPLRQPVRYSNYKSIRRHLLRTYLYRHRQCIPDAFHSTRIQTLFGVAEVIQDIETCPMAAAFVRWSRLYRASEKEMRRFNSGEFKIIDSNDADDIFWSTRVLAEFYSCAATAYEFELFICSGQQASHQMTQQLGPYCSLAYHGAPCWILKIGSHHAERQAHLFVGGDARIVDQLEMCGEVKCGELAQSRRVQRRYSAAVFSALKKR